MPIVSFQCDGCGHEFEEVLKASEMTNYLAQCPQCEAEKCTRLISAHGGYRMNSGPSSVRPKNAGAFKRSKQ